MLNIERLYYELLANGLPDVDVAPQLDVDSIEEFPLITFSCTGGEAIGGAGGRPTAWETTLDINIFHDDFDKAIELAGQVYDLVWSWDTPWAPDGSIPGMIPGLGHANEVDDQSLFTRVGQVEIDSRSITQLSGAFSLQAHSA